jgi:hypothetical protein
LTTLTITHNRLRTADDIRGLLDCPSIRVVDMSHNKLEEPEAMEVFHAMEGIRVIMLVGNPMLRKITQYRKTTINTIKTLSYLDDRPIFPKERVTAEAFCLGGRDAEREARTAFQKAEQDKQARGVQALMDMQRRGREEARQGVNGGDPNRTDSEAESESDSEPGAEEDEPSSYEPWQFGSEQMAPHKPNIMDQMSGKMSDNANWEPHPDLMDEEPKVVDVSEMDEITGPKAADIDLFDSEDEFEELDEDFMNQRDEEKDQPMMSISSSTRTGGGGGKVKMLIQEVEEPAKKVVGCINAHNPHHTCSAFCQKLLDDKFANAAAKPKAKTKKTKMLIVEEPDESDDDEIEEVIVGKKSKKTWFTEKEIAASGRAAAAAASGGAAAAVTTNDDDSDSDAPPDLEEVDADGVVTNIIGSGAAARAAPAPSAPAFSGIQMIDGDDDDMEGLD